MSGGSLALLKSPLSQGWSLGILESICTAGQDEAPELCRSKVG